MVTCFLGVCRPDDDLLRQAVEDHHQQGQPATQRTHLRQAEQARKAQQSQNYNLRLLWFNFTTKMGE